VPGLATSRVPIGLYSGTAAGIIAREQQISGIRGITVANLPSWDFNVASMGAPLGSGWNTPRVFFKPNIHCRIGGTHLSWLTAAGGSFDTNLIATLQSIGSLSPYPTGPDIYLSVQEEQDGADGASNHAAGRTQAQAVSDYRAWANHVKALAAIHCPRAKCGQVVADVTRLPTWFWPEAEWYGADPHFYGWNANGTPSGGQFSSRMNTVISTLTSLGVIVGGVAIKPWSMHVGGVENPNDPNGKANYITLMGQTLESAPVVPDWVTWWDRSGNVNGSTANETIDSSPQSLAAFAALFGVDAPPPPPPPPPPPTGSVRASGVLSPMRRQIMVAAMGPPSFDLSKGGAFTEAPTFPTGAVAHVLPDIDVVMLEDGTDTVARSSYTTGTVTPTISDGELVVYVASQVTSGTPGTPTVNASFDLGLTWTQEEVATNSTMRLTVLKAPFSGGAPSPGVLQIDFGANQTIALWSVLQIENAEVGSEIAQSDPSASSGASIVTHSLAGPTGGNAGNRVILGTYYEANELANETWATTLTRLQDVNPISGFMVAWEPSAFDSAPFTDWTTNARWRSIALEIRKRTV